MSCSNIAENKISTWDTPEGEQNMQEGHGPSWRALINRMEEKDLTGRYVLDYGCNRGGFLRMLHKMKPFAGGLGVDIAEESLAYARDNSAGVPCEYAHIDALAEKTEAFDFAFSHEVLYLLPDLHAHARQIHKALKPGGVYYVAIGEYTENPLWERWEKIVSEFSPVPPYTYSLQDMARAFQDNGFDVAVRRLVCDEFLPYDAHEDRYIRSPMEMVDFMTQYMMMFRLQKKA